jgi:hypothetical protein
MNSTPRFYSAAMWLKLSTFSLAVCLLVGTNNWFHPNKETISIQKTATTELSVLQKMKPIEVIATNPAAQGTPEILVEKTISILKSKFVSNLFVN